MTTPPVKKRHRSRRRISPGARYAAYAIVALSITAFICYANYLRVIQLETMAIRRSVLESQLLQNPRFRALRPKINTASGYTTVSGMVATQADLEALKDFLRKTPAPARTRWRLSVEVQNKPQAPSILAAPQLSGSDAGRAP